MKAVLNGLLVMSLLISCAPKASAEGWGVGQWLEQLRAGAQSGREQMPKLDNVIKNAPQAKPLPKQEKMQPISPELLKFSSDYKNMPKAQPLPKAEPLPKQASMPPVGPEVKGSLQGKAGETRDVQGGQLSN